MNRRDFLQAAGTAAILGVGGRKTRAETPATRPALPEPSSARLPRWRGFNLLAKFNAQWNEPFREADFALIAEWEMNFVRLPLSYRCWADPGDVRNLRERPLKEVDQAIEFGRRYGIHINVNLHRAPGYCVNEPPEPTDLWKDDQALDDCAFHWAHFAKRYKGIPNSQVSFNPLNEPKDIKEELYVRVMKRLAEAIRAEDPQRLIIADGLKWGTEPVMGLAGSGMAQSTRGYRPTPVSHYEARWVQGSDNWPEPGWPLDIIIPGDEGREKREAWDKDRLRREYLGPWRELESKGVGVHVGEFGAHNRTPHAVALAWMKDYLDLWREAGWGWAMWNLHGSLGVLNSERRDVAYENFRGQKLDRKMLEILREG